MDDNTSPDQMLTVAQVARRLGRSIEQVRRYLREGKLEGRRLGGQWFVPEHALAARTGSGEEAREPTEPYTMASARDGAEALIERVDRLRKAIRSRAGELEVEIASLIREDRDEH